MCIPTMHCTHIHIHAPHTPDPILPLLAYHPTLMLLLLLTIMIILFAIPTTTTWRTKAQTQTKTQIATTAQSIISI